ncbi:transposase family protein [Geoalkalibacter halelectricus]|uniref:Transposase family protein n=2 Tax=Geoalkalibacter halelectricus TaxID=2847045 RepID=A0ABY5ZS45_9BACT|nr:transposase family protein [Geoalkalibacter halelectricus]UWZ81506.1 transposase family protein [Geoalkalibacter halelectricus]
MFMPNDVYSLASKRVRVLWSNWQGIFWIEIDNQKALPRLASRAEFEHLMASGEIKSIDDPYVDIAMTPPKKGSRAEEVQDRAWDAIKDVVSTEPEIYERKTRGNLLESALKKSGATKQTVYRWLRRYWQFGMCKNALSGRYDLCGGPGKAKKLGTKKIGAPRTRTPGRGINVDESVKSLFRVAIEKCLLNESENEFDYTYNQVLIAFGVPLPSKPEDLLNVPTERQLRYFYEKEYSPIEITRKRKGEIDYLKDFRPVLGTSTSEVSGPGSRYQIDATVADVYLVSEQDREKIIGRPTLYFVVDVFSRTIVGMYIGLENASWVSAMEALANAMLDKVEYCASFGINITNEMWPTVGLPEAIIGDRGEMLSRHVEVLSKGFNVNIENTPPYRADWKGVVERYFRTVQVKMKPFVEGYVTGKVIGKKRHGKDYRQDGIHTLYEFTQMMIKIVLFYNNNHLLSTYDPDKDIPDNLPHNPLTLWNWGIEYRTGRLRRPAPDLVKVNILPHTEATVTEHGLKMFGCYYTCREAIDWGWFEGNYKGPKKITVAYDLYSANIVYIRPSNRYSDFIIASLTERSRSYRDLTIWEVWEKNDVKASTAATSKLKKRSGSVNLVADLETIAKRSKAAQPKPTINKAEKVKNIDKNKKDERKYERQKKGTGPSKPSEGKSDNVIPIHGQIDSRRSFRLPSRLKDLLKEDPSDD